LIDRRLGGTIVDLEAVEKGKIPSLPLPGIQLQSSRPLPSLYTD
jgi:hypothetical protein